MGLINPMNEKSGALPDNENDIQSEKRQSAISAEFQWFSGRNYASVNRAAMVIAGSSIQLTPQDLAKMPDGKFMPVAKQD